MSDEMCKTYKCSICGKETTFEKALGWQKITIQDGVEKDLWGWKKEGIVCGDCSRLVDAALSPLFGRK